MSDDTNPTPVGNPDCANCAKAKAGVCRQHAREAIGPAPEPRGPGKPSNKAKLAESVTEGYVTLAVMVSAVPHPAAQAVGLSIGRQAGELGQAWAELADKNPKVKAALESLGRTSAVAMVVAAHVPIVVTALAVTGSLPPELAAVMGVPLVPPPEPEH